MATGYNDVLNGAYVPAPVYVGYTGPTGGNWITWTVNASTIKTVGPTGATGTTMTLSVPSGGVIRGTIGGTGAMLLTTNNVYLGQGAGWNDGAINGYTGAAYGYGVTTLFGITGATGSIGIGVNAAAYGQATNSIAIGNSAGIYSQGPGSVAIGYYAGGYTGYTGGYTGGQGINSIAIGYQAGYQNDSSTTITAPYVSSNSPLPGTANNCVGGFSYNGQYTGFCQNGTAIIYLSTNYGGSFITTTLAQNIFGYNISSTGQYHVGTSNTTSLYYSSNYGGSFTTVTLPTVCSYAGYLGGRIMSSNGRIIFMTPLVGTAGVPLYSNNGGSIGTPTFSVFPASSGLYLSTSNYYQSGMDTTGQYIVAASYNTLYAIYYSNNGTAGANNVTFTNLLSYTSTNGLPTSTYFQGCSISGNAKYMFVGGGASSPYVAYISSNANASVISTITFSPTNELPTSIQGWNASDISDTGQYMVAVIATTAVNVYVSYNYGVNWSLINGISGMGHVTISLDGNYILALPNTTSATPANGLILVLTTIPSNTNDIAIGYQAGYQNQNGNAVAIGTSAGSINQPVNGVAIGNNAGNTQDQYTYSPYITFILAGYQIASAMSYNGQLIFLVNTVNAATIGSINYGQSFASTVYPSGGSNIINGGIVCTSSARYIVTSGYNTANVPVYYSSNGTSTINSISFTSLSTGPPQLPLNGTGTSIHIGVNPIAISSDTGQYILVGNYYSSFNTIGNQLYYSSNGGSASASISQITFTNIAGNLGMSSILATRISGGWFQPSISQTGQYIIAPYSADFTTGQSYLFYSTNGNTIPSLVTFTSLLPTCGIPLLQQYYQGNAPYTRGTAMSSNGQYILVSFYGTNATVYLSSNGGALSTPSTITFTNLSATTYPNGFPTITQNYNTCAISSSGQYMAVTVYAGTTMYTSTNFGVFWSTVATPCPVYHVSVSGDGTKMVICSGGSANANYVFSYTLQQNTVANTVAIGNNAGNYNQGSNSVCLGNNANAPASLVGTGGAFVINGGNNILTANASGFFVNPVRTVGTSNVQTLLGSTYYSSAGEVFYNANTTQQLQRTINLYSNNSIAWTSGVFGPNIAITNINETITFEGRSSMWSTVTNGGNGLIFIRLRNLANLNDTYINLGFMYINFAYYHFSYPLTITGTVSSVVWSGVTPLTTGIYSTYIYSAGNGLASDAGDSLVLNVTFN